MRLLFSNEPLAWLAFAATVALPLLLACSARIPRLRCGLRPLAVLALVSAIYTAANAVMRLPGWDPGLVHARLSAAGGESNPDLIAQMAIPLWPYAATALGVVLALLNGWIVWRPAAMVAFMHPVRPASDRIARERARVARFDE